MDTSLHSFGDWLKQRRNALHLTQAQLAKQVHCATVTIRKIESDFHRPSPAVAERLAAALGLSFQTQQQFCKVARAELPVNWLPLPSSVTAREPSHHSIPTPPTSLVGRAQEIERMRMLLAGDVRLLTLTGPPGVGKTRLAIQVAHAIQRDPTIQPIDGVWFVSLAAVLDPELVPFALQQALGIQPGGQLPPAERLSRYLASRQLLLVLDNCEHLLPAMPLVSAILAAAPGVKVLATSRAVLHLSGEHEFVVPPLAVPDAGATIGRAELLQYPSLQLFLLRARAVRPDIPITDTSAQAMAAICRHLDGLPLAIELAAARIKLFLPEALWTRLDDRLTLLTGGAHDLPARQQTLRAAIDWSYSMLAADAQALFIRMAVFVGGCTLAAVEAVCITASGVEIDALDGATRLVDQSLVQQHAGPDGEPRFTMLETVREYALEQLAARGEAEATRRRHAETFCRWVEMLEPKLYGAEQGQWFERLELEHPNLRAALTWSQAAGDPEIGLRLAGALARFWYMRSYVSEGRRWLKQLLARANGASPAVRAKALIGAGNLAKTQSDLETARIDIEAAIALCLQVGNNRDWGMALCELAQVHIWQGDYAAARVSIEKSIAHLRLTTDQWKLSMAIFVYGHVAELQHDLALMWACAEESLALAQAAGDRWVCAGPLFLFGRVAYLRGDYLAARARYKECVGLWREIKDLPGTGWGLRNVGLVALILGDCQEATACLTESLAIHHQMGDQTGCAICLMGIAAALAAQQRPAQAIRAARLWGAAERTLAGQSSRHYLDEHGIYEREIAAARSLLGEPAFDVACAEGRAMTYEQAVAYAIADS